MGYLSAIASKAVPVLQDALGIVYPFLATTKAAIQESPEAASQWLTYWSVVAALKAFEFFCEWLVSWFPHYAEMKLLLVCWLILPRWVPS